MPTITISPPSAQGEDRKQHKSTEAEKEKLLVSITFFRRNFFDERRHSVAQLKVKVVEWNSEHSIIYEGRDYIICQFL